MTSRERIPWLRLWLLHLQGYTAGPYMRSISLAIDAATIEIEAQT